MNHHFTFAIAGTISLFTLAAVHIGTTEAAVGQPAKVILVGFSETDITPDVINRTVYMAGFGQNRVATKVHDALKARTIVIKHGKSKVALVSVDLVGLFRNTVQEIRSKLTDFDYVLVSSTHNHEGPDTMGIWGPNPFQSGIDLDYLNHVKKQIVKSVRLAEKDLAQLSASVGTVHAPELLHDSRLPNVKHDELVTMAFRDDAGKLRGLLVQWNCHPETLGGQNTEISADFVTATVEYLKKRYQCPVVYFTGTVGGLMTSLHVPVNDDNGNPLKDGTFAKTTVYGRLVGKAVDRALTNMSALHLHPFRIKTKAVYLPIENPLYIAAWQLGVFQRDAYVWKNDAKMPGMKVRAIPKDGKVCVETEIGLIQLGQLSISAIPGEIYPELVLDKVQDPVDVGADFPRALVEPAVYKLLKSKHKMIIGLANDEIGYIIPKRQWDQKSPYCYGRKRAQYGEVNSLGPETAPLLCEVFQNLAK